jgi:AcrR family transcriptional regulator
MGRQAVEPTPAQRGQVAAAAGAGVSHRFIAQALGISAPTLRRHFREELTRGAAVRRFKVVQALYEAAMRGKVAAMKAFLGIKPAAPRWPPSQKDFQCRSLASRR